MEESFFTEGKLVFEDEPKVIVEDRDEDFHPWFRYILD
jgi:hypothetical protein